MSRQFFIINLLIMGVIFPMTVLSSSFDKEIKKEPIIITSQTLTADSKNNTAIFEGSVVARSGDVEMHSDKMAVFYSNSENKVSKIHAVGNVKVHKKDRALFSDEATYFDDEGKIIFTGNPKAVEGENVISGSQIIFFIKDDRVVVEKSRVILQNNKGLK